MTRRALLIVDVQIDFCPGGSLPVPQGDLVVPILNKYQLLCREREYPVFASRDWHPARSSHFAPYGGKWPVHCVQNTRGAQFHPDLHLLPGTVVLSKGMDPEHDGYTAFQGIDANGTGFRELLERRRIRELMVGGLATDYCVKWSVIDALRYGFSVRLLTDAVRGVEVQPGDSQRAIDAMVDQGAIPAMYDEVELECVYTH